MLNSLSTGSLRWARQKDLGALTGPRSPEPTLGVSTSLYPKAP